MNSRILYLHGRPSSHYLHNSLASSLHVDAKPIDDDYRWQDQEFSAIKNFYSWLKNALNYKKYKNYDFILVDGLHFSPVIARKLGILPKRITIIAHMGNQLPYFILAKRIPSYSRFMHKWLFDNYDYIFCEGKMMREMIQTIKPGIKTKLLYTFLGPLRPRVQSLRAIQPGFKGHTLLTIAAGPTEARRYYKGMDIMVSAFSLAKKTIPDLKYYIVGDWDENDIKVLTKDLSISERKDIFFTGHQTEIDSYIKNSDLYLHVARGDAFPTSTIEAMHAGLPLIVSNYTGTRQILKEAGLELIVNLSSEELAAKINWFFALDLAEKKEISSRLKQIALSYTEDSAIEHYRKTFEEIAHEKNTL